MHRFGVSHVDARRLTAEELQNGLDMIGRAIRNDLAEGAENEVREQNAAPVQEAEDVRATSARMDVDGQMAEESFTEIEPSRYGSIGRGAQQEQSRANCNLNK